VGHAEKAINKIRRKQQEEAAAAPAGEPAPEPTE
jgi:hypothetical protein